MKTHYIVKQIAVQLQEVDETAEEMTAKLRESHTIVQQDVCHSLCDLVTSIRNSSKTNSDEWKEVVADFNSEINRERLELNISSKEICFLTVSRAFRLLAKETMEAVWLKIHRQRNNIIKTYGMARMAMVLLSADGGRCQILSALRDLRFILYTVQEVHLLATHINNIILNIKMNDWREEMQPPPDTVDSCLLKIMRSLRKN